MDMMTAIKNRILGLCGELGITQAALAHAVGVSNSHMIESAKSNASLKTIMKIADCSLVEVKAILVIDAVVKEYILTIITR